MATNNARNFDESTTSANDEKTNALQLVGNDFLAITEDFFAPVASDMVEALLSQHESKKLQIESLASVMNSESNAKTLQYFIDGNLWDERRGLPTKLDRLFNKEGALAQLNAMSWQNALNLTDVYDYMPQKRRDEWQKQIKYPLGKNDPNKNESVEKLPDFTYQTVAGTLSELLKNRPRFFAERVDAIFFGLSRSHITNQPHGFSKRLIIQNAIKNGSVDYSTAGLVNDLRAVIAKFMGRDEPKWFSTSSLFNVIRMQNGVWQSVDGGALRMRIYNGVGTVHIEVHEEMAWRLNAILAFLYPKAIPAKFRHKPVKKCKPKEFELFDKPLPFTVINYLAEMEQDFEMVKHGYSVSRKYIPKTLRNIRPGDCDKATRQLVNSVLLAIGGVNQDNRWTFDYEPESVIAQIICNGAIPDHKSHQFYATPESLAQEVVALALDGVTQDMTWCEPSAGVGGIADYIPRDADLLCCEISPLHCKVLEAKGYASSEVSSRTVQCVDFLQFAAAYKGEGFDRIVQNAPFSEGRWEMHLKAAASILKPSGRLVSILPSSAINKELVEGYRHSYGQVLRNKFAGTSVSVVVLVLERCS